MTGSQSIYLDCDDVILDFLPSFISFVRSRGFDPDPSGPGSFDMAPWLGVSRTEVFSLIKSFNEGEDTGFDRMDPIIGAVESISKIREMGFDISIVSSFSDCKKAIQRREDNLSRIFGHDAFRKIIGLPLGQSKSSFLQSCSTGIFIDDLLPNVIDGHDAGHRAILFGAHHNQFLWSDPHYKRITDRGIRASRNWNEALIELEILTSDFSVAKKSEIIDDPSMHLSL